MPNTPNIAVTLGWLSAAALQKSANAEEMIVRGLRSQAEKLPKEGILDLWYDMNNRKARLNAGDWADSGEIQQWKTMLLENEWVDSEGDIELLDEAGGPGTGDWIKIASSHGVDIRESAIAGRGLFATRKYEPGDILVASYITKQNTDDPRTRWEQSDFARYTNHADKPNAYVRKRGETCELVAEGNLSPNEEITVNYRDVTAEIGKAFFFTYRGKSYGNDADAVSFMQKTSAYKKANFYGLPVYTTQELTGNELAVKIAEDGSQKQALSKLQAGLLGAGLGGAVGGVTDWATKDEYADDYNLDSTIDGILGGALLGGTAGVLGHGLYTGWNNIQANRGRAAKQDAEWRKRYSDTGNQTDDTGTRARSYNEILDAYLDPLKRPKPPAGSKTISLADVLPPGYREKAQQYAEKYRASGNGYFESDNPWHQNISDAAINRKVPTYSVTKEELANSVSDVSAGDIGAVYEYPASANNGNERILLPKGGRHDDIIGHELTHSAQRGVLPNDKEFHARPEYESAVEQLIRKSNKYRASNHQGPISNTPGATANYLTNPHEEEAYLAEIKRNYWKATGKHVTNQASARAALDWLRTQPIKEQNPLFDVLLKDNVYKDKSESSLFRRLMGPEVNEDDPDRESWIKGLIQRMPGLVNNIRKSPVKNAAASIVQNYKIARTTDDILQRILKARKATATDVSEGNATAGNYKKGRFKYHGLKLSIENPKGSTRSGTAADGKKWSTKMKYDYGYIRETMGADGDPVDVFMGDDPRSELVFIINQNDKSGKFDEHKVVLGAMDARQAKQTYLANYEAGWTGCGSVVGMTMPQFKDWLKNGDIKKPAGEVKQAAVTVTHVPVMNRDIAGIIAAEDIKLWSQVPNNVPALIKSATDVKKQIQKAILNLDVADKGYGQVYWHPKKNNLWITLSDSDDQETYDTWWKALSSIPGINKIFAESEVGPPAEHIDEWVRIKRGSSTLNPFTLAGKPFGGPTALTNGIVGALIGGGVGYGGGRLAEMFLPARHFDDEHRLSRTLGMAGAAIGGMPGVVQGFTNAGMNADAGDPSWSRSFMEPPHKQKVAPNELNWYKHVMGKYAHDNGSLTGVMSGLPPIRVDRFNNVIWQDPYSTPAINAAAAGIVSGISQQYGGAKLLTPKHFIRGLAAAGVDYATATVAGGILGTLGGLKPEAQKTLQDMGLWSGLIRGSIGSILGQ